MFIKDLFKSKIFYFSLIVLLSSIFVNYYVSNIDYDVDYDWMHGGNPLPRPIFNIMLWAKRTFMLLPGYIFPPNLVIYDILTSYLTVQALRQVSELEIADLIKQKGGKMSVKELSTLTNTNEESLGRILRALSVKGIFHHHGNGIYSNNRLSSVLRKDHPNTIKYFIEHLADEAYIAAAHLEQALKYPNGWDDMDINNNNKENEIITPWSKAFGVRPWEYYGLPENKYRRIKLDKAMHSGNAMVGDGIFADYDWELNENTVVVDVGGGNGGVTLELIKRYNTKGVIFDLPQVMESTQKTWNEKHKEFLDRVEFFPGSFFEDHPPQADVYLLRWILHDWSDTSAVKILKNLRSSITSNSTITPTKLIILDAILDEPIRDASSTQLDLLMLTAHLGKERTPQDFIKIINKSGWKYVKHVYCRSMISIIEAIPDFDQ